MNGLKPNSTAAKAPTSFWIVSGLGLLWNAFGGYLYVMTQLRDPAMMKGTPEAILRGLETMPAWAISGYAVGVWASLIGSVLMVMRSRHAGSAFFVSLIGAAVSFGYQFSAGMVPNPVLPAVIMGVIALLWWYAKRSAAQGLLK